MAEEPLHDTFSGATKGLFGTIGFLLLMFGGEIMVEKQPPQYALGSILCIGGIFSSYMGWAGKAIRKRLPDASITSLNEIAGNPRWWLAILLVFIISISIWHASDKILSRSSDFVGIQRTTEAQKSTLIGQLQQAQLERAAIQQRLTDAEQKLREAAPLVNPDDLRFPPPKDPYLPGKIFVSKYSREEATQLISALEEIMLFAHDVNHMKAPEGLFEINKMSDLWVENLKNSGVDSAISELTVFSKQINSLLSEEKNIVAKYPIYTDDLTRLVGNTNLGPLDGAVQAYIGDLEMLKRNDAAIGKMGSEILYKVCDANVTSVRLAYDNFRHWDQTFVNNRAIAARRILESYL